MAERRFRAARLLGAAIALMAIVAGCQTVPGHGALTEYIVILRYFGERDSYAVMRVMANEFPGYRSHRLIKATENSQRYEYRTTAKAFKLEEWLGILLRDMGFDVEREVAIRVQGSEILVDQRAPRTVAPLPKDQEPTRPPRGGSWAPITGDRFR